ncbi:MAG: maleylpyruvate isomerase N-terminal domain-containing protein [Mycobacterium kyogaense]|uniref:maleylpyruvate isomerase N-terminal domain-containing protein n=1 Tax=Mycobacterium kyogaense TaxID=2212479 RepID=UPI002FF847B1
MSRPHLTTARLDRAAALRAERTALLEVCEHLFESQWLTDSKAQGWTVRDVVAHMGSGCHGIFTPSALKLLRSNDIEATNDDFVAERRSWPTADVLNEYRTWSSRVVTLTAAISRTPFSRTPMPLAELGSFPAALVLGGAMAFDHHTHLRHDILPALDLPDPGTDANRMGVVVEWMLAVLHNQLTSARPSWLTRPVTVELRGDGGGAWTISRDGVRIADSHGTDTRIMADVRAFPEWATQRCAWRDRAVDVSGDESYAATVLDHVNIV